MGLVLVSTKSCGLAAASLMYIMHECILLLLVYRKPSGVGVDPEKIPM